MLKESTTEQAVPVTGLKEFHIHVQGAGSFACLSGETVLAAMERQGLAPVSVGCRRGGCSVCRVQVVSGQFALGKISRAHITDEQLQAGFGLACRLYPESDMEIVTARPEGVVVKQ